MTKNKPNVTSRCDVFHVFGATTLDDFSIFSDSQGHPDHTEESDGITSDGHWVILNGMGEMLPPGFSIDFVWPSTSIDFDASGSQPSAHELVFSMVQKACKL